jgi:putative membrane protein
MKTTDILKIAFVLPFFICMNACDENVKKETDDSKDKAEEHNDAKFDKTEEKDAQFLVDATEIAMMEIQMSELAENQGSAEDIKELGKMIKEDHSKSLKEIQKTASAKMITIPNEITAKGKESYDKLLHKTGSDFDKAYCDEMVENHKSAIEKYEKAASNLKDSEIKNWANTQLATLRSHLDKSMDCRDKYDVKDKDVKDKKEKK